MNFELAKAVRDKPDNFMWCAIYAAAQFLKEDIPRVWDYGSRLGQRCLVVFGERGAPAIHAHEDADLAELATHVVQRVTEANLGCVLEFRGVWMQVTPRWTRPMEIVSDYQMKIQRVSVPEVIERSRSIEVDR